MPADTVLLMALPIIAAFIAWPAVVAFHRRRVTREASEVAVALAEFAGALGKVAGRAESRPTLDAALDARAERLRVPEYAALRLALELPQSRADLLADTAQRLALRLKRRVAFERKMLARTASGRRRGAIVATSAPLVLVSSHALGMDIPHGAVAFLLCVDGCGCWLLWRIARVQI
jgi:hypothetical protein